MRLEHKVAAVASSGGSIGKACAQALLKEGAKVILLSKNPSDFSEFQEKEQPFLGLPVKDFTDEEEIKEKAAEAVEAFGSLDVIVNSITAVPEEGVWNEIPEESWRETFTQILTGNLIPLKYLVPSLVEKESGRIVIVSALPGRTGVPGSQFAYTAAHAGLGGMVRNIATVFGKHSITCNGIAAGQIEGQAIDPGAEGSLAGILKEKTIGAAQDVANAVLYLTDEHAAWNTGETLDLNGGRYMV